MIVQSYTPSAVLKRRALETGFCKVKPITVAGGLTYGEAICQLEQGEGVKFIGHGCMKSTPVSMRQPVLWQVELV